MLLVMPIILVALSLASIFLFKEFASFSNEMHGKSIEVSKLKSDWSNIKNKKEINTQELLTLNHKILSSVEGAYEEYSELSKSMSESYEKQYYTLLFVALLNICFVVVVYRKYKSGN